MPAAAILTRTSVGPSGGSRQSCCSSSGAPSFVHTAAVARPRGRPRHSALPRATRPTTRMQRAARRLAIRLATTARKLEAAGGQAWRTSVALSPRGRTCARLLVRRAAAAVSEKKHLCLQSQCQLRPLRDGADPLGGVEHGEHAREVAGHGEGAEAAEDALASKGPPGYVRCYLLTCEHAWQGCRPSHMIAPARRTT